MQVIDSFYDDYDFLSNFAITPVNFNNDWYRSSEHAFNALKATNQADHDYVKTAYTPSEAKKRGRSIELRRNWDKIKFAVMRDILYAKFCQNPMRSKLLATGNAILIEGNTWHDQIWGDCQCPKHIDMPGQNALGLLLMYTRLRLSAER